MLHLVGVDQMKPERSQDPSSRVVQLDEARLLELVDAYQAGTPNRELAVQFEINEATVHTHLKRLDVECRPYRKLHGEQLGRAVELYAGGHHCER